MNIKGKIKKDISLTGKIEGLETIPGFSAYEVAVINGFEGTEAEWLASLKGPQGEKGEIETGSEFVFLGGDAEGSAEVGLVIDKELSQTSENVVQNRAIAKAVSEIRSDINAEFSNKVSTISDDVTEAQYPTAKAVKEYVDAASDSTEQTLKEYIGRVKDYIVEQGPSGRWTYRKWASGIAECWGNTPEELHTIRIPYGNAFIETHIWVEFPQNLFVSTPTVTAHFSSQRQSYGCPHATMREVYSNAMEVSVTDNASSERWGFFCISAIGRWK